MITIFRIPIASVHRVPRRHGVVEQQTDHIGAPASRRRIEYVRDVEQAAAKCHTPPTIRHRQPARRSL
jgi:hypothetical protein